MPRTRWLLWLESGAVSCREQAIAQSNRDCTRDHEAVVHRMAQVLLAAEVALSSLHRGVTEQKLDLFQLASTGVA